MILRSGRVKPSFVPERRKRSGQVPMTMLGEIRFRGTGPLPAQYAKYEFDISRPSEPFYSSDAERLSATVGCRSSTFVICRFSDGVVDHVEGRSTCRRWYAGVADVWGRA